jgi:hypothetical protein
MLLRSSMCLMFAVLLLPRLASAALGEPESTATEDARQLKGQIKSTEHLAYRVHEMTLPSGTVVREYAMPGGNVFAVAWSGPAMPNLNQTLGSYFGVFTDTAKARHAGRTRLEIQHPDFVMQSGGHMRAFTGRAYLPQALPAGMTVEDIR